jgi:hypothetical protein
MTALRCSQLGCGGLGWAIGKWRRLRWGTFQCFCFASMLRSLAVPVATLSRRSVARAALINKCSAWRSVISPRPTSITNSTSRRPMFTVTGLVAADDD